MDEFIERTKDADIVLSGRYGFPKEALLQATDLKMISVWQTGYDHIYLESAAENRVIVSNVHGYVFDAVAELVFAFALNLFRKVHVADDKIRKGIFDWRDYVGNQLMGKTIGVIGTGKSV